MQTIPYSSLGIFDFAEPLEAGSFYDNFTAGRRGMCALAEITGGLDIELATVAPDGSRFDQSGDPDLVDNVVQDVRAARQIILSLSGDMPHLGEFKRWLVAILQHEQKDQASALSLLGLDKKLSRQTSRDFDVLIQVAVETELDFIEPWTVFLKTPRG